MKLKDLKRDISMFSPRDYESDVYFEDEEGKIHKVNMIGFATRVKFKELGSDSQMQILIQ